MVNRQRLLNDLKPLLKQMEADLRARCDEVAEIDAGLKREYNEARAADRTGATFEEWRADLITQVAVAWVLSCVFVRFLEDNELISPPRISGRVSDEKPGDRSQKTGVGGPAHSSQPIAHSSAGLSRARDERDLYFRAHPTDTDRDYLLSVFDDLAKFPGTKDVFGPHNPVSAYRNWLSGDAAQKLIEFFQKVDTDGTGEIIHDFTDPDWDTRFLGDLYQDLSEAARKKYALLQTPIFVEEFILERTLEPAISEFGLAGFKMIDPACGSGHFLLGSFARILARWRKQEPGTPDRELVNRSLMSVHGVDLNPYAVAIARFRVLLAAMHECRITQLKDSPAFKFNLACGDSLLHGARPFTGGIQTTFDPEDPNVKHVYSTEDRERLVQFLGHGQYHAVMANPPYITPKDAQQSTNIRSRYTSCYMQYALSVPFMERIFDLAVRGDNGTQNAGFTGQITANSFMKREFGKRLIEQHLKRLDLTHVIDTSGAFIPGHGTPTVVLFGRNRLPVTRTIRAVLGIKGEPSTPEDPSNGLVWTAILNQLDRAGSQSDFVSVTDAPREQFDKHPWSIGGGGAAELKERLDQIGTQTLCDIIETISAGICITREDDAYLIDESSLARNLIAQPFRIASVQGEHVRDWRIEGAGSALFPYDSELNPIDVIRGLRVHRFLWPYKELLWRRRELGGDHRKLDRTWWEWNRFLTHRFRTPVGITYAEVASHNHFVIDRGGKVFNRTAPVIKLPADADENAHLALLGLLNSSTACFWMKQVSHQKQMMGGDGIRISDKCKVPYAFNGTMLEKLPIPKKWESGELRHRLLDLTRQIDAIASTLNALSADAALGDGIESGQAVSNRWREHQIRASRLKSQMVFMQEELDFTVYALFDLCSLDLLCDKNSWPNLAIDGGDRPFCILAQSNPDGFVVPSEVPLSWPEELRQLWQRRIDAIRTTPELRLIEDPHYKRRWIGRQGLFNHNRRDDELRDSCERWLLNRLETYFDLDGRMSNAGTARGELREPRLTSAAKVADFALQDKEFMGVAELYVGRMDFDVVNLVMKLVTAQTVPYLPLLRYKPSGLDKRTAWERTWDLQRLDDSVDALFEVEHLRKLDVGESGTALRTVVQALRIDEHHKPAVLRELTTAAGYVAEAAKQRLDLASDTTLKPVKDAANRAKKTVIGEIPAPPKYVNADFASGDYWRLRGKLDVPKERWVSFPHCEGEDGTLVIAWAGYDHLQLARAIAERYELAKEQEGRKLVPLLAAIGQLIPWLKQWHNDVDPMFGTRMGDYFEGYLAEEAKALGLTVADVMAWTPPAKVQKQRARKIPVGAGGFPDSERDTLLISAALSLVTPEGISEDLHLDAMILMATPGRCRELVPDVTSFETAINSIDSEFWTDSTIKWKRVRKLLSQANAITVDPHSGLILRREPGFSKLRQRFGTAFDALGSIAITAGRSIQNATAKVQRQQDTARKREKRTA